MHTLCHSTSGIVALTRIPSRRIADCELTYLHRGFIDHRIALQQHEGYVRTLRSLGLSVINLPAIEELPDTTFVEDTALVLDELAIMASPCASRRGEISSVREVLARYRKTTTIPAHAKLEGGDVIRNGRTLYVGQSTRTDLNGLKSLRAVVAPYGYNTHPIPIFRCLHLSTAASCLDSDTFLINASWIDGGSFPRKRLIPVPGEEPWAANVLSINRRILLPSAFPRTADLLDRLGYAICTVEVGELLKAEAGVSCLSLIFHASSCCDRPMPEQLRAGAGELWQPLGD